jgi:hypothetical protein
MAHGHITRTLPAELGAPPIVNAWRRKGLIIGLIFAVLSLVLAALEYTTTPDHNIDHFLRAWLLGYMICFGFSIGGLALLMVQYCSGGKWGLLIRRPLEAMTRTLPLVAFYFIVVGFSAKRLYLWARYPNAADALKKGLITAEQAHAIAFKHPMLNLTTFWIVAGIVFSIWGLYMLRLNRFALDRDADPEPRFHYWQTKFENISGFGILVYSLTMTAGAIYWVMSLDVTWYSSIWGLLFLVGQGYQVLALSIITVLILAPYEPFKTVLRITEQHDLGKFTFAFVMLNIYLAFSQFLIIWSGNLPDEIPWYLDRFRGGWGVIITLDFIFHWLIPFTLLLSRDLKRNRARLILVCKWMIFARCWDMFWLIEPSFRDSARNLHFSWGILEYATLPTALISFWFVYYFTQLQKRPLVASNDPHVAEILEPDHAHA